MGKFKIVYDSNNCIGAGVCESMSKDLWSMKGDKAVLKGAKESGGVYELEVEEAVAKRQEAIAGSCPAGCITVKKL